MRLHRKVTRKRLYVESAELICSFEIKDVTKLDTDEAPSP
jgi:hypothetical protein